MARRIGCAPSSVMAGSLPHRQDPAENRWFTLSRPVFYQKPREEYPDKFDHPIAVAVAEDGSVFVADFLNNRIQKWRLGR